MNTVYSLLFSLPTLAAAIVGALWLYDGLKGQW